MTTDIARLLDLPALASLSVDAGELALITVSHEHADRMVVERRRLGASIDLHELLGLVGMHGIADAPRVELSNGRVPELPAPIEESPAIAPVEEAPDAPVATVRRMTRNGTPEPLPCPYCERTFATVQGLGTHRGKAHRGSPETAAQPAAVEPAPPAPAPEPEPAPEPPASSTPDHWTCPQCGKQFKSRLGYTTHVDIAHAAVPSDAASVPLREYSCTACNTPLIGHLRCSDCQALLGPGHDAGTAQMVINGKPLCRTCVAYRGEAKKLMRTPS